RGRRARPVCPRIRSDARGRRSERRAALRPRRYRRGDPPDLPSPDGHVRDRPSRRRRPGDPPGRAGRRGASPDRRPTSRAQAIGPREHAATGTRSPEQLGQQLIHLDWDHMDQGNGQPARLELAGHVGDALSDLAELVAARERPAFPTEALDAIREGPWRYAEQRVPWAVGFFRELEAALP